MKIVKVKHTINYQVVLDKARKICEANGIPESEIEEIAQNVANMETDSIFQWAVDRINREDEVNVVVEPLQIRKEEKEVDYAIKYYVLSDATAFIVRHGFKPEELL